MARAIKRRWLWVGGALLGCGLLGLGFAIDFGGTRGALRQVPSTQNPDAVPDDLLVDAFLRSVGAANGQPTWRLRRWKAPIRIAGVIPPPPSEIAIDSSAPALELVLKQVEKVASGLLEITPETPACPSREPMILLSSSIWGPGRYESRAAGYPANTFGIFYAPPDGRDPDCYRWVEGDGDILAPTLSHAGTTTLRVNGVEIIGALVRVGYAHGIQYSRYDLAVDVLRQRALSPSAIAAAMPLISMKESYELGVIDGAGGDPVPATPAEEDSAGRIASEHKRSLERGPDFDATRCYSADFEDHAHSVVAYALSQALGIDWGARLNPNDLPTLIDGKYDMSQDRRRPNIELVKQSYRARDYWLLRRYWPLFVSVLYDPEVKGGMSAEVLRPIAARLIADRRNKAEYRANIERQPCMNLPRF